MHEVPVYQWTIYEDKGPWGVYVRLYKAWWGEMRTLVEQIKVPYLKEVEPVVRQLEREYGLPAAEERRQIGTTNDFVNIYDWQ